MIGALFLEQVVFSTLSNLVFLATVFGFVTPAFPALGCTDGSAFTTLSETDTEGPGKTGTRW